MGSRLAIASFLVWLASCAHVLAQEPPQIVSLDPPNGSEVDTKACKKLVVVFDRAMKQDGYSLCGGGPTFPKTKGTPKWRDEKTLEVAVELEPDHEYVLGVNCPAAQNTRSKEGIALVPVWWKFSTLPGKVRPAAEQKKRNQQAAKVLREAIDERYSYRDLRVADWDTLWKQHTPALLAA